MPVFFLLNHPVFAFLLGFLCTDDIIPKEKGDFDYSAISIFLWFDWRVPQTNPGVIPSNLSDSGNS